MQPPLSSFVAQIQSCQKDARRVQILHAQAAQAGLVQYDLLVANTFIDSYAKCGALEKAQEVFDMLHNRDVVTWTALIAGYVQHGCGEKALYCYERMLLAAVCPNAYTYSSVLKACTIRKATNKGIHVHSSLEVMVGIRSNLYICNALLNFYGKCGMPLKAFKVFNENPIRDVVSWTSLVAGCIVEGFGEEALSYFKQMQLESFHPNTISFTCILSACSSMNAIVEGRQIHAEIEKRGLLDNDLVLGTALVNMYAKCGVLEKAQEVFDRIFARDIVAWTTLTVGYESAGCSDEALKCLEQMQVEGFLPDSFSLSSGLKACGTIGACDTGRKLHAKVMAKGSIRKDISLNNAIVGMYANCGLLAMAKEAFDNMASHDVLSWTTLMMGYAHLGEVDIVTGLFDRMRGEGVQPDAITFITVLNAFSHSGLVDKGQTCFEAMSEVYGIVPALRHHSCLLDLQGRCGQLRKAEIVVNKLPFLPSVVMWDTVLSACQKWVDIQLGEHAFGQSVQSNDERCACYMYMGNILANVRMLADT